MKTRRKFPAGTVLVTAILGDEVLAAPARGALQGDPSRRRSKTSGTSQPRWNRVMRVPGFSVWPASVAPLPTRARPKTLTISLAIDIRPDDTLMSVLGRGHDDSRDYVMYEKIRSHNMIVRSRDGGKTWVDGTDSGTPFMNRSTRFKQIIGPATVELEPDRFFTAYSMMAEPSGNRSLGSVEGFFWSLKRGKD